MAHSPYKERAEQEIEKLENVKEKRDNLYSKASPRETASEDDPEAEANSKIPLIATVAVIIAVILTVLIFVL